MPKPYPVDAVMVLAAPKLKAMVAGRKVACRECGRALMVSEKAYATASVRSSRLGKPVAYVCHACLDEYDTEVLIVTVPQALAGDRAENN